MSNQAADLVSEKIREILAEKSSVKSAFLMNALKKEFKFTDTQVKKMLKEERTALTIEAPSDGGSIPALVKNLWHDSQKNYYRQLDGNEWDSMNVEQARRHLRVVFKIGDDKDADAVTELDIALHTIETENRVTGALPFPLNPLSIVEWNSQRFLNTATAKLTLPAEGDSKEWGDGFPWLAFFLDNMMPDPSNKDMLMAWLRVWYKRVLRNGNGGRGQAVFLVGPPKTGKTFFSNRILGSIFGGVSDVSDYFVEGSQFNSTIFNNVTWALDDSTILGERGAHEKFSGLVKKVVANPSFPYDAKWGYKGSVPFNGRFICTMNDGPASIRILPDTDQDLLDKVIFLRTGRVPAKMCGSEEANLERVTAELPAFLRWLTNTDHADWVSCKDERCGIDSWHEPSILSEAKSESRSGSLGEILDMWRESCAASGKDKGHWEGTSAQLLQTLGESACINRLIQGIKTPNYLSGLLNALIDGGYKYATRPARKRIRIDF